MILMDKMLFWTIATAITTAVVAVGGYFLSIWIWKNPGPVEIGTKTLKDLKKGLNNFTKPEVQISYFAHASLGVSLESTNLGAVGVNICYVVVSNDLVRDSPIEMYPVSLPNLPHERQMIPVSRQVREYFEDHMIVLYRTGRESRNPTFRVSLKYEASGSYFYTNGIQLEGRHSNGSLVDLQAR